MYSEPVYGDTRPRSAVLCGYGINADRELCSAFRAAGAIPERITVKRLTDTPSILQDFDILALPGGFSFGDHLGSGLVLAQWLRLRLREAIDQLLERGGLVIGICNGFQVLVKMGLLPNLDRDWSPQVSLVHNQSGTFLDSWVPVEWNTENPSPWLKNLTPMMLPVRNGEGRFIPADDKVLSHVEESCVALRYRQNPNGSVNRIAGITDPGGRVLGLMPHPEAFIRMTQHPQWQRLQRAGADEAIFPTGVQLFRNAVQTILKRC